METFVEGKKVETPFFVTFAFKNEGRRDISSDSFDKGRPLEFSCSHEILAVLQSEYSATSAPSLPFNIAGRRIRIGPELIPPGAALTIWMLVEAGEQGDDEAVGPQIVLESRTTADVSIVRGSSQMSRWNAMDPFAFLLFALLFVLFSSNDSLPWPGAITDILRGIGFAGLIITILGSIAFDMRRGYARTPRLISWLLTRWSRTSD